MSSFQKELNNIFSEAKVPVPPTSEYQKILEAVRRAKPSKKDFFAFALATSFYLVCLVMIKPEVLDKKSELYIYSYADAAIIR